ncbi:MAG: DUF45 domain-containing protein [Mariprofundus sp.]|nr:DUF45 domain-containing protein [Mariprofundus sp.]
MELKNSYLRNTGVVKKVAFDSTLHITRNALGIHTSKSRVQGAKLKAVRDIHIATMFKNMPIEFLRMIVVHELSHMKESDHNKAFYKLCCNMEPNYHQLEFDLRVHLPIWKQQPNHSGNTLGRALLAKEAHIYSVFLHRPSFACASHNNTSSNINVSSSGIHYQLILSN